jgi:acyl carrier protein
VNVEEFCRRLEESLLQPANSITPERLFADIPNFDSMSQIEVVLLLDEMYGVQVPDGEIPNITCVQDLAPIVAAKLGSAVK